jgi:hypothetical protein
MCLRSAYLTSFTGTSMNRLLAILLLIPATLFADGVLCYIKDTTSKAEKKAASVDLKSEYTDPGELDIDTLPRVYRKDTNDVWRRVFIDNAQAKWFCKVLPTETKLTADISSTMTTPTNTIFLAVTGTAWETAQTKAGFKDFTNVIPKDVEVKP